MTEKTVTVEIAIPVQPATVTETELGATFAAANRVTTAIGPVGRQIDAGFGFGFRDLGIETDDPDEVIRRAKTVAPEGTEYHLRPPLPDDATLYPDKGGDPDGDSYVGRDF